MLVSLVRVPVPTRRSPSWGAWIEIPAKADGYAAWERRSPSWGAWIEILRPLMQQEVAQRRSPSWGAWIEICCVAAVAYWP